MIKDILDCLTAPAAVLTPYAPTGTGTNINTASYINRIVPMDDGAGNPLSFEVLVTTAATSGGSATVQFALIGNPSDPTFTTGNVRLCQSDVIAVAALVAGYRFAGKVNRLAFAEYEPIGTPTQYLALAVIIGTAALTAGAFNSWVNGDMGTQDNLAYKAGYTV